MVVSSRRGRGGGGGAAGGRGGGRRQREISDVFLLRGGPARGLVVVGYNQPSGFGSPSAHGVSVS